jgi:hypothetical protein
MPEVAKGEIKMNRGINVHLTTEEFVQFVNDDLSEELEQEIDYHIAQCEPCALELQQFYDAEDEFPQERWAMQRSAFAAELRGKIFAQKTDALLEPLKQLVESWLATFAEPVASFTTGGNKRHPVFNWQSEDGALLYSVTEEMNGDWYVLFESTQPDVNGKRFQFRLGSFEREVILEQVTEGEFAAELLIPRSLRPEKVSDFELKPIA